MNIEKEVAEHYADNSLAQKILDELGNPETLTIEDLLPHDEFHIGGRRATEHFMALLGFKAGSNILDVGCGIGGAARYMASVFGARVTGVDLTPEFIEAARTLTQKTNIEQKPVFEVGSALSLPFEDAMFDGACTLHAAMNIKDKAIFYSEVYRVLKPGAVFGIYDILAGEGTDEFAFPAPWAATKETSFLVAPDEMQGMLTAAGFEVLHKDSRRDFARGVLRARLEKNEPKTRKEKSINLYNNVENNLCAPWEIICRKP